LLRACSSIAHNKAVLLVSIAPFKASILGRVCTQLPQPQRNVYQHTVAVKNYK
jgi:hypothetical protein